MRTLSEAQKENKVTVENKSSSVKAVKGLLLGGAAICALLPSCTVTNWSDSYGNRQTVTSAGMSAGQAIVAGGMLLDYATTNKVIKRSPCFGGYNGWGNGGLRGPVLIQNSGCSGTPTVIKNIGWHQDFQSGTSSTGTLCGPRVISNGQTTPLRGPQKIR